MPFIILLLTHYSSPILLKISFPFSIPEMKLTSPGFKHPQRKSLLLATLSLLKRVHKPTLTL